MLPCNVIQVRKLLRLEEFRMGIDRTALLASQYQCSYAVFASQDIDRFLAGGSITTIARQCGDYCCIPIKKFAGIILKRLF